MLNETLPVQNFIMHVPVLAPNPIIAHTELCPPRGLTLCCLTRPREFMGPGVRRELV